MAPRSVVIVVVLVVLSGCGGMGGTDPASPDVTETGPSTSPPQTASPTQSPSPTQTETPAAACTAPETDEPRTSPTRTETPPPTAVQEPDIEVVGGSLAFDPNVVWQRVESLMGVSAEPPEEIRIQDGSDLSVSVTPPEFSQSLGFESTSFTAAGIAITPLDYVILNASLDRTRREAVLAHEFVHFIQVQRFGTIYPNRANRTAQQGSLAVSVAEGGADYVQEVYWREYMDRQGQSPAARLEQSYTAASPSLRRFYARYRFGQRYIADRLDSPAEFDELYENPPRTTEEMIHRLPPGSEPPVALDVRIEPDEWIPTANDTRGELFVRNTLQLGVDDRTATRAAAGWGNDRVVRFDCRSSPGFVWTLRWDDAANATEFGEAFRASLDARGTRERDVWTTESATFRLYEPDDRTVAIAFGPRAFVENVSVTAEDGEISVETP